MPCQGFAWNRGNEPHESQGFETMVSATRWGCGALSLSVLTLCSGVTLLSLASCRIHWAWHAAIWQVDLCHLDQLFQLSLRAAPVSVPLPGPFHHLFEHCSGGPARHRQAYPSLTRGFAVSLKRRSGRFRREEWLLRPLISSALHSCLFPAWAKALCVHQLCTIYLLKVCKEEELSFNSLEFIMPICCLKTKGLFILVKEESFLVWKKTD